MTLELRLEWWFPEELGHVFQTEGKAHARPQWGEEQTPVQGQKEQEKVSGAGDL